MSRNCGYDHVKYSARTRTDGHNSIPRAHHDGAAVFTGIAARCQDQDQVGTKSVKSVRETPPNTLARQGSRPAATLGSLRLVAYARQKRIANPQSVRSPLLPLTQLSQNQHPRARCTPHPPAHRVSFQSRYLARTDLSWHARSPYNLVASSAQPAGSLRHLRICCCATLCGCLGPGAVSIERKT